MTRTAFIPHLRLSTVAVHRAVTTTPQVAAVTTEVHMWQVQVDITPPHTVRSIRDSSKCHADTNSRREGDTSADTCMGAPGGIPIR